MLARRAISRAGPSALRHMNQARALSMGAARDVLPMVLRLRHPAVPSPRSNALSSGLRWHAAAGKALMRFTVSSVRDTGRPPHARAGEHLHALCAARSAATRAAGPCGGVRGLHYESGHHFREYQGWDGGPAPSKLSLLFRPVLFSGAVVFGGLGLAAIYRDEQYRKQSWVWPARRQATALDVMGWRFTVPQLVCGSLIAGLFE